MRAFLSAALLAASVISIQAQDAEAMMRNVRLAATVQKSDLFGSIRKDGKGSKPVPVALFLKGEDIQFKIGDDDTKDRFHVRMSDDKCTLLEVGPNHETSVFPSARLATPIAGTDLTYEDLTLRFLYWPHPKLEGEEKSNDQDCWKIRLDNPDGQGAFGVVYVWVTKNQGAFWTIKAYDRKGTELKEFQVNSLMKLPNGNYTLKQMAITPMAGNRVQSTTYLEFNPPGKRKAAGLKD